MVGVFGELEPGVLGEIPGSVVLPGVPDSGGVTLPGSVVLPGVPDSGGVKLLGAPDSGGVTLPGSVVLPGVPDSGGATLPGAGVKLLGVGVPDSGGVTLPGAGVKLLGVGVPDSGGVTLPGSVVLPGVPDSGGVMVPGAVVLSGVVLGVVSAGTVVLLGALGVTTVPLGQRELSGKYSHRIFIPSGDILISAGALLESLLDWAMGDLLDSATAILVVNAKDKAAPIRVRDFPIIL